MIKKEISLLLVFSLLFSMIITPAAQANLWSERRQHLESMKPVPLADTLSPAPIPALSRNSAQVVETRILNPQAAMIYHFQDVHQDVQAQKNLAQALAGN